MPMIKTATEVPSPAVITCGCGSQMRLRSVKHHTKSRGVEVLVFGCLQCDRTLHIIEPLGSGATLAPRCGTPPRLS
jgi:hypothetical protein